MILEEFERSGVCVAEFARRTGLNYSTLAGWVQRYRQTRLRIFTQALLDQGVQPVEAFALSHASTATNTFKLPEKLSMMRPAFPRPSITPPPTPPGSPC
jgi:transposase-like protein